MLKFSAEKFYRIASALSEIGVFLLEKEAEQPDATLPESGVTYVCAEIQAIKSECSALGLKLSTKCATRALDRIKRNPALSDVRRELRSLYDLIDGEMEEELFLWVPSDRAAYYTQAEPLFGDYVARKFRSASFDIEESGKCFALGRFTASVLHCMRVLEIGLRAVAQSLHVRCGEKSMQGLLGELRGRWNKIEARKRKPPNWKVLRQFYNEAFIEFGHFKDAWRNYASHGMDRYDEERAEKILDHVRGFMQHLATKLKESP